LRRARALLTLAMTASPCAPPLPGPGAAHGRRARGAARALLTWYDAHRRDLPWRRAERARNPYCVWLAEVMLQQTRVAAAAGYYERFLARFPDLASLAEAREADVLALWSGLGYYRRARQLWRAARLVQVQSGGQLPSDYAVLRRLPGIGRYTAGAIASIAFQQPVAAVDGNVRRVMRRYLGREWALRRLETLIADWGRERPGDFNQALMDLGATICLPRSPRCPLCPWRAACRTRGEGETARPAAARRPLTERYALARRAGRIALVQRPAASARMAGLWELPRHRGRGRLLGRLRHAVTISDITAEVYAAHSPAGAIRWASPAECAALPLTGLARKILRRFADTPAARLPG